MRKHTVLTVFVLAFSLIIGIQLVTTQVRANVIEADVDIHPDALLLKDDDYGKWITAIIRLPEGYQVNNIDVSSVILRVTEEENVSWSWYNIQGKKLMVKFDRATVKNILRWHMIPHMFPQVKEEVQLEVWGKLYDDNVFRGIDKIRVFFSQS